MRRTVLTIFALSLFMLIPVDALAQTTQGPTKIKGTATNGLSLEVTGPTQLDGALNGTSASFSGTVAAGASITAPNLVPSVIDPAYGAVGDNATDNTASFTAMENSAYLQFYLPCGIFKTSQSALQKLYTGCGSIVLGSQQNDTRENYPSSWGNPYSIGLDEITSFWENTAVDITWIGDSQTQGYVSGILTPTNYIYSYPYRIQALAAQRSGGVGQGLAVSGCAMDRLVLTGSTTFGTNGPCGRDLVMQPGATASFTAQYVRDMIVTTYNAAGRGTITITGSDGTWTPFSTATGSGEVKNALSSPDVTPYTSQTITMSCTVGVCELTNIFAGIIPVTSQTSNLWQVDAQGGYTTAVFNSTAIINSIAFNRIFAANGVYSIAILDIGTNDIYATNGCPYCAVPVATYKANLIGIVTKLKAVGITPILTVPLHPTATSTYQPIYAPFEVYRNAAYEVARTYECQLIDKSELDIAGGNLFGADGLHPTADGYGAIASLFMRKLSLWAQAIIPGTFSGPIASQPSPTTGAVAGFVNDSDNVNRGQVSAVNRSSSPVATWGLGSYVEEAQTGDYIIDSIYGNVHVQRNRINVLDFTSSGATFDVPIAGNGTGLTGIAVGLAAGSLSGKQLLAANYTNATTTPSTIFSWNIAANTNYTLSCEMTYGVSATTDGLNLQLIGPASPTKVMAYTFGSYNSTLIYAGPAFAASTNFGFGTVAASSAANYPVHIGGSWANGSTAGTLSLQAYGVGSGTLTVNQNSWCVLQ